MLIKGELNSLKHISEKAPVLIEITRKVQHCLWIEANLPDHILFPKQPITNIDVDNHHALLLDKQQKL